MDFVLWKPSGPQDPAWPSPGGIRTPGRPGWHIECSAMSAALLGETFDIHGGGIDLVFPHHENEIAQSRCAHGTPVMARTWLHNGFLQVEGEKMSKSLGNFVTIHELLKDWPGEVVRLNMLRTHYRQPMDWTVRGLQESETVLRRFCGRIKQFDYALTGRPTLERNSSVQPDSSIVEALSDDLNTPLMLSRVHELRYDGAIDQALLLVGIDVLSYAESLRARDARVDASDIELLINARLDAKKRKDFKEADRIRDELTAMGVVLKDSKDGTTWEVAR
jgi:cysteinyl-tRNA synthetase